ncbi:hypothetical protein DV735_g4388, partial [Chaetothyriales sp. CBS 134920]
MTTLEPHAFAPLHVDALDEKMDMVSPPFHRVEVEDIDLESDLMENPNLAPAPDNFMDDASDIGNRADDDMRGDSPELLEDEEMKDEGQGEVELVENELDMDEDPVDFQDEEDLIYDAEEETATADAYVQLETTESEIPTHVEEELFDFDETDNLDTSAPDPPPNQDPSAEDTYGSAEITATADAQEEAQLDTGDGDPDEHPKPANELHDENAHVEEVPQPPVPQQHNGEEEEGQHPGLTEHPAESHEQLTQEHDDDSSPTSPLDQVPSSIESLADIEINALGPHFVTLTYKESQYPLFSDGEAPDDQPFPLSDTNLIFEPLEKLLEACKERVFTADQDHLDEVVLIIPVFALKYCQDSKFASKHSLWDILRLYVKLKQNEGAKSIEPLNCSLYIQTCLDTQFRWLIGEAHKQIGYSDLDPDYVGIGNILPESTAHTHELLVDELDSLEGEDGQEEHGDDSHDVPESAADAEIHETAEGTSGDSAHAGETDAAAVDDSAPGEEQANQASEFFEDAFEDEQEADEVEDAEEKLELDEDARALEEAEVANQEALETAEPAAVRSNEQTDLDDQPQPFKIVEEVEEIILEEEDLTIDPEDPLSANEDPDALLEGRSADVGSTEMENGNANGRHAKSPSTPELAPSVASNSKLAKRKAEGEDDILELDFDTPQPKRVRPSPP